MATVPHVTSGLGLRKFQADGSLLTQVYPRQRMEVSSDLNASPCMAVPHPSIPTCTDCMQVCGRENGEKKNRFPYWKQTQFRQSRRHYNDWTIPDPFSTSTMYCLILYRVSQEECARLREGVPYVKVYRYNPKHLCSKLNGYGDIGARKVGLLAVPRTVPGSRDVIPIRCPLSVLVYSCLKRVPRCDCTCKVLGNRKDNYDMSASVFVVQFNGFMSLTSYFDVKYRY